MHLPRHQEMLRNASMYGGLAGVIKVIAKENPGALHIEAGSEETLSQRVFFHHPAPDIPMKGFVTRASWATATTAT